jgi:ribosomal protein L17
MLSGYPPREYERFEEESGEMKNGDNPRRQSRHALSLDANIIASASTDINQPPSLDKNLIANLTTSVEVLSAQRIELRFKLAEVEGQLAKAVQALQTAKYPPSPSPGDTTMAGKSFDFKSDRSERISGTRSRIASTESETYNAYDTRSLLGTNQNRSEATKNEKSENNNRPGKTASFDLGEQYPQRNSSSDSDEKEKQLNFSLMTAKSGESFGESAQELDMVGPLNPAGSFDKRFYNKRTHSGSSDITDISSFNNGIEPQIESSGGSKASGFGRMFSRNSRINSMNSDVSDTETKAQGIPNSESRRSSFNSHRPKTMERNLSFTIEGMTEAEVQDEIIKTTSKHARSAEEINHKLVTVRREPTLLEEPHDETFFELFYDLILVVVFIKLSYLKYDMTVNGILTVAAIFSNFWSCWSLMNCYATMLHTEDMIHRLYYVFHITASFIMAITIQHPSYSFFSYHQMVRLICDV